MKFPAPKTETLKIEIPVTGKSVDIVIENEDIGRLVAEEYSRQTNIPMNRIQVRSAYGPNDDRDLAGSVVLFILPNKLPEMAVQGEESGDA